MSCAAISSAANGLAGSTALITASGWQPTKGPLKGGNVDLQPILKDKEITRYLKLWAQRSGYTVDERSFELGRMSVALMLESQSRILEEFGSDDSMLSLSEHVANSLREILRSLGIDDDALDVYESVCTMQAAERVRYVPDVSDPASS